MKKLWISTASCRMARRWRNEEVTWEELCGRLGRMPETAETPAEYRAMARDRQTDVKDIGGFVGGRLRDGIRKAGNVECRSVVTLDYDRFSAERLEDIRMALDCAWAVHSTHKHTDEAWRVRLVVPCSRPMGIDEYGAVSRRVAEMCGFDGIDRSTFEPCRLMFWGSRSKGAPYVWERGDGEALDVDGILGTYADWSDMSLWPMLPEEAGVWAIGETGDGGREKERSIIAGLSAKRQEDPRAKSGLIGAFCRTYDVEGAIEKFLSDTYRKSGGRRYTHVGSSTSKGAWVLDEGRYLYSFHSTDPAFGKLLNSWDLVRLHLFRDLDRGQEAPGGRSDRLPSFRAMEQMAMDDEDVRLRLMDEKRGLVRDFDGFDLDVETEGPDRSSWREWDRIRKEKLKPQKDGTLKTTITNCAIVIAGDPRLKGHLRLDDFTGQIRVEGELPWRRNAPYWTNNDDAMLRGFLDREYGLNGAQKIDDALISVANDHGYHPVRSYLSGLEWDGVRRLDGLFTDVLGAEDTELNRELAKLFFVGAVTRVFRPGAKFDYFIIVKGPEGSGKSSLFALMGGEWFSDSVSSIEGKEGMESVQGKWIIEMPELVTMKRSEVESMKSFISRQEDRYRPAYGRKEEMRPRQCVMVGTTNEDCFLRGLTTGNRRSPVVDVQPELRKVKEPVRDWVTEHRDQVWAEAMCLYREGYPLWLGERLTAEAKKTQDAHNLDKQNSLFPEVNRFLDLPLPSSWETNYSQAERIMWLDSNAMKPTAEDGCDDPFSFAQRQYITVPEILQELLRMKRTDAGYYSKSREIGQYLNSLGGRWEKIGSKRNKLYGVQMTWARCNRRNREDHSSITDPITTTDYMLNNL